MVCSDRMDTFYFTLRKFVFSSSFWYAISTTWLMWHGFCCSYRQSLSLVFSFVLTRKPTWIATRLLGECGLFGGHYIVAYISSVGIIFGKVAHKLTKDDTLGINSLIGTLCITPGLLILLLQLMICPSYRKPVLSMSIFAALNGGLTHKDYCT